MNHWLILLCWNEVVMFPLLKPIAASPFSDNRILFSWRENNPPSLRFVHLDPCSRSRHLGPGEVAWLASLRS